jgi:hypothetical protein
MFVVFSVPTPSSSIYGLCSELSFYAFYFRHSVLSEIDASHPRQGALREPPSNIKSRFSSSDPAMDQSSSRDGRFLSPVCLSRLSSSRVSAECGPQRFRIYLVPPIPRSFVSLVVSSGSIFMFIAYHVLELHQLRIYVSLSLGFSSCVFVWYGKFVVSGSATAGHHHF